MIFDKSRLLYEKMLKEFKLILKIRIKIFEYEVSI